MSSQIEYFKGEVCGDGNCKSRRYFEGDDGFIYCKNGHMKEVTRPSQKSFQISYHTHSITFTQGYRATQQDEDDFGNQGRISRRKREVQEKASRSGDFVTFFQAFF